MLKARDVFGYALIGAFYGLMSGAFSSADNPAISHSVALALWPLVGALAFVTGFIVASLSGRRPGWLVAAFASGGFVYRALSQLLVQSRHSIAKEALVYMMVNALSGLLIELSLLAGGKYQRNA